MIQEHELLPFYDTTGYLTYPQLNKFLASKGVVRIKDNDPMIVFNSEYKTDYFKIRNEAENIAKKHYYRTLKGLEHDKKNNFN